MTFDPFRDFEERGYLRNLYSSKDVTAVKALEQKSFKKNLNSAIDALATTQFIEYKHILGIHKILFGDIYPWAGEDRLITTPDLNITKGGYERMFAHPRDIRRASEYALDRGQDSPWMRERAGEVMGLLAHAHPFLDGNGRTIMVLHAELAHRASISIDWKQTDKIDYLAALTIELNDPGKGHLDLYLKPFIRPAIERQQLKSRLANPLGLDEECLMGLSIDELTALASCKLAVAEQTHLDNLVSRNTESLLSTAEIAELDELLAKADRLTVLKTRARYTIECLERGAAAA